MHSRKKLFSLLVFVLFIGSVFPQNQTLAQIVNPELPRVFLDTTFVPPTGRTYNVATSVEFQSALDNSLGGDEIVLDASKTFAGPFILPKKSGNQMITIRTSDLADLPGPNQRVGPANASAMPKILATGGNEPALKTAIGAHHYRIIGIEFAKASPSVIVGELIRLGASETVMSDLPNNIILDRIYAHGDPTSDLKRCVGMNSAYTAVIDSYISDCHVVGQDAQAIGSYNGSGPFKIHNNHLEGSGENIIFGGSDPLIPNLVSADIEITNNHITKPLSWKNGTPHWSIKNLLELKNAQRVLIEGNVIENNWLDAQTGYAVLFTPRNQDGNCNWCGVADVTFQNNLVRHSASGVSILGHDDAHPSQGTQRIKVYNNLFDDINGPAWGGGSGWLFLMESGTRADGPSDVQIVHNTGIQSSNMISAGSFYTTPDYFAQKPSFVFKDNLALHNDYGVKGGSAGVGQDSINKYYPSPVFTNNIMVGGNPVNYSSYPGNFFPASTSDVGFVNFSGADYHLNSNSAYKNKASDNTDIGVNIDTMNAAIGGTAIPPSPGTGPTPTPPPPPPPASFVSPVVVASFDIQPNTAAAGTSLIGSFNASSGSAFVRAELWRANYNDTNCSASNRTGCTWSQDQTIQAPSSITSWPGVINVSPPQGKYWYGIHILDSAGSVGFEPSLLLVTINAQGVVTPTPSPTPPSITPTPSPSPSPNPTPTPSPTPPSTSGGSGNTGTIVQAPSLGQSTVPSFSGEHSIYQDGSVLIDNGVIYLMEFEHKRPVASMAIFTGLGYKLSQARAVDTTAIPEGPGIFTAKQRHVRGAVVNDHGTIYFMGKDLRYAFPSAEIFFSWGNSFKDIVPANKYDLEVLLGPIVETKF